MALLLLVYPRRPVFYCRAGQLWCTYGQVREGDVLTCVQGTTLPIILRGLGQGALVFVGVAIQNADLEYPSKLPAFWPRVYCIYMEDREDLEQFNVY